MDDIVLAPNDYWTLSTLKEKFKEEFNMTDLGKLRMFLGITLNQSDDGMYLSQQVYTRQMLKKCVMNEWVHWIELERILWYLQGTADHGRFYLKKGSLALSCYADS